MYINIDKSILKALKHYFFQCSKFAFDYASKTATNPRTAAQVFKHLSAHLKIQNAALEQIQKA